MFTAIATLISLGSFVWSFFQPIWAWVPLSVVAFSLLSVLLGLKLKKWQYVVELSPSANEMLQKFGHFYSMPFAGTDFSSACSAVQLGAVAVGIVGVFNDFWWGAGLALSFWFIFGPAAMFFNPTVFIRNQPGLQAAHEEVMDWIISKRR